MKALYQFVMNSSLMKFDVGGLFPAGKNEDWESMGTSRGNCWRYACNDPAKGKEEPQAHPPGIYSIPGQLILFDAYGRYASCADLKKGIESVHGIKACNSAQCPPCHYAIFAVLKKVPPKQDWASRLLRKLGRKDEDVYSDFHFYRQDTDDKCVPTGTWSHKRGKLPIESGITDPAQHARDTLGYKESCGYYCLPCSGLDADLLERNTNAQ
jgi:hypothetical protein